VCSRRGRPGEVGLKQGGFGSKVLALGSPFQVAREVYAEVTSRSTELSQRRDQRNAGSDRTEGQEELHIEDTVQRYEEKVASRC